MTFGPGRADGGHRAPSSHGNPNRWTRAASTCTSVFTPSPAVGRKRNNTCSLLNERVRLFPIFGLADILKTTWTFMSLTDFCMYFHLLLKQTSVSKAAAAALIAAVPDHQLESDKVAISSQQSGAIICRCWHLKKKKKKNSLSLLFLLLFCFFVFCPLLSASLQFSWLPTISEQNHPGLSATAACIGCIWNRKCSSSMRSGAVGDSLGCRHWIHSQPTERKIGRLMRFSWKKRIPRQYFYHLRFRE